MSFNLESKPENKELMDFIKTIDPLSTTPIVAMNYLFKIKDLSNKK